MVGDLLAEFPLEQVVDDALARMAAQVPEFRLLDRDRLRTDMRTALGVAVAAARADPVGQRVDTAELRAIGAQRAEQGIGMEAMLHGFRIVTRTGVEAMLALAARHQVDSELTLELTLELTRLLWAQCDDATAEVMAGHRAYTDDPARRPPLGDESALRTLLEATSTDAQRAQAATRLGLCPDRDYRLVVVSARTGLPESVGPPARAHLLASYVDPEPPRVVGVVDTVPLGSWDCVVGYGDPAPPGELHRSLPCVAEAWEMALVFGQPQPRHPDDVRLLRAVHQLPELGDELVQRCFGHLAAVRRQATVETLQAWFAADGNVDAAAEALFVHRNTLRYRLRAFTDASGLRVDRPEDAFSVWWALRRLQVLDSQAGRSPDSAGGNRTDRQSSTRRHVT